MKPDYGRTTITVPFELKKRMKKVRGQVNWSAVACEAFEAKLEELGPVEEITSIEDAAKRMKAIDERESRQGFDENGKSAGIQWAMNYARPNQLRRIEEFKASMAVELWEDLMCSREGAIELAKLIEPRAQEPGPSNQRTRRRGPRGHSRGHRPLEVWRSILENRPDHPRFFLGFAEGTLEVWDQLKGEFE